MMKMVPVTLILAMGVFCWFAETACLAQTGVPTSGSQQYPHQLTAAELRSTVPNSTVYSPGNWGPKSYANYRSSDGHIHVKGPDINDVGVWRITGDGLFCTKYNKLRNGQETCQTIWLTAPDTMEAHLPNGQIAKSTSTVPGNPEGL